jgi:dipeptidyl aminopeptidase/acylaminoacyl peptidase
VTQGDGIEWSPVVLGEGKGIAFFQSNAQLPGRAMLMMGSARPRDIAGFELPSAFPLREVVTPQPVTFAAADGLKIHGQLFLPPALRPGDRRPALVFFHGGSRRQMLLGWHYMQYYHNTYAFNQYLALRGYVVLAANYRSGIGYGLDFREAENYGARGASELADVLAAGRYLQGRTDVDSRRIGAWGGSYGGYLTALALSRASDLFAAGVDIHGVHDWNVVIRNFAPTYDPRAREEVARLAFSSSPMSSVKGWRSPVLLIHGDDDRNVPFSETVDLVQALREQKVEFEQLIFPDEVHDFLLDAHWTQAFEAAADFLDRRLRASKPDATSAAIIAR